MPRSKNRFMFCLCDSILKVSPRLAESFTHSCLKTQAAIVVTNFHHFSRCRTLDKSYNDTGTADSLDAIVKAYDLGPTTKRI